MKPQNIERISTKGFIRGEKSFMERMKNTQQIVATSTTLVLENESGLYFLFRKSDRAYISLDVVGEIKGVYFYVLL